MVKTLAHLKTCAKIGVMSGIDTGGPPALNQKNRNILANNLDKFLTRHAVN